jgi:hypothetical protein
MTGWKNGGTGSRRNPASKAKSPRTMTTASTPHARPSPMKNGSSVIPANRWAGTVNKGRWPNKR